MEKLHPYGVIRAAYPDWPCVCVQTASAGLGSQDGHEGQNRERRGRQLLACSWANGTNAVVNGRPAPG